MDSFLQNKSGGVRHNSNELGSALIGSDSLIFSSVENIPGVNARAAFTVNSAVVFREDCDIMPSTFGNIQYMPWGVDNQMPYNIIDLIERDETLATCQIFNAEICYGSGLVYDKTFFTHQRLRSAMMSLTFYLPYLFTYQRVADMPNTNNMIEGTFTDMKKNLRNHPGMIEKNRQRMMNVFFVPSRTSLRLSRIAKL